MSMSLDYYAWIMVITLGLATAREFWLDQIIIWRTINGSKTEQKLYYSSRAASWTTYILSSIGLACASQIFTDIGFLLYLAPLLFIAGLWVGKERNFTILGEFELMHDVEGQKKAIEKNSLPSIEHSSDSKKEHLKNSPTPVRSMVVFTLTVFVLIFATLLTFVLQKEGWISEDYFHYALVTNAAGLLMLCILIVYKALGVVAKLFNKNEE